LILQHRPFRNSTARLMRSHFARLLRNVATAPDLPLAELSGPDEQARRCQLNEFNPKPLPAATVAQDRCIHELIADQATHPSQGRGRRGDQKLLPGLAAPVAADAARLTGRCGTWCCRRDLCRSVDHLGRLLGVLLSGAPIAPRSNQPEVVHCSDCRAGRPY
jgi:non-ribosomal peptide synthetase component F